MNSASNTTPLMATQSMGELAAKTAGASRVFYRHGLDFCCGGNVSLAKACDQKKLNPDDVIRELQTELQKGGTFVRWDERPLNELVEHILKAYHEAHREELPRLIEMAQKVVAVHADKPSCPHELADHLMRMAEELEEHMQKEEQILFPLIQAGRGSMAAMPIQMMEMEHRDHGNNLETLREMTANYQPPAEACGTWIALYLGLAELERDLMEHIHTENNILFPRALCS